MGRDLTIVSDQDTEKQTAPQSWQSASLTVGYGISSSAAGALNASFTLSETSGNATGDYRSVTKQSGVFAGDGGFNVSVTGVTTLTGAARASTADASLNSLKTGALVRSDLQNASSWQAKSSGSGSGISISRTDLLKDALTGGIQPSLSRNEHGASSGTAASTIAPGTITILDAATQQMLTGMTPEQAIAAVNRAAAAQNKAADKLSTLSQTLKNQADVAKAFAAASTATASAVDAMAQDIVKYEQSIPKDLKDPTKTPGLTAEERAQQDADAQRIIDAWKAADLKTGTPSGAALILTQGLTQGILGGILGGNSVMAGVENGANVIASNVIADQVQKALKDAGLNIDPKGHQDATFANILAQAVTTGVGAALDGSEGGAASLGIVRLLRGRRHTSERATASDRDRVEARLVELAGVLRVWPMGIVWNGAA